MDVAGEALALGEDPGAVLRVRQFLLGGEGVVLRSDELVDEEVAGVVLPPQLDVHPCDTEGDEHAHERADEAARSPRRVRARESDDARRQHDSDQGRGERASRDVEDEEVERERQPREVGSHGEQRDPRHDER